MANPYAKDGEQFFRLTWRPCGHSQVVYRHDADINQTCPECKTVATFVAVEPAPAPAVDVQAKD